MNVWHDLDPKYIHPDRFIAVVEIPEGSKKKYELDKRTGLLRLDRILHTATHYPANYGFIPRTYADDRDPLDVLVLCSQVLDPLVEVECFPIGCIRMMDGGDYDDKIIAVPCFDPTYNSYTELAQLPPHITTEIANFDPAYSNLDDAAMKILGLIYEGLFKIDTNDIICAHLLNQIGWYRIRKSTVYVSNTVNHNGFKVRGYTT